MKPLKIVTTLLFAGVLSGCSTLRTLLEGKEVDRVDCVYCNYSPRIYSGVFWSVCVAKNSGAESFYLFPVDFFYSLALDTVVLPYTTVTQVAWGSICPPPEKADGKIVKDETSIEGCKYMGDIKVENIPGGKFDRYVLKQAILKGGNTVYLSDDMEITMWHGPGGTAGNTIKTTVKAYLCKK